MSEELKAAAARWGKCDYNGIDHAEMYEQPLQRARDAATLAQAYRMHSEPLAKMCLEILAALQNPANKDYAIGSDAARFIVERWQASFDEIMRKMES